MFLIIHKGTLFKIDHSSSLNVFSPSHIFHSIIYFMSSSFILLHFPFGGLALARELPKRRKRQIHYAFNTKIWKTPFAAARGWSSHHPDFLLLGCVILSGSSWPCYFALSSQGQHGSIFQTAGIVCCNLARRLSLGGRGHPEERITRSRKTLIHFTNYLSVYSLRLTYWTTFGAKTQTC